ncbi:MAG: hydroxyethylthiazole kinase [Pseudomonadota bacterium]
MKPNDALAKLRQDAPLVHCITNYVAMNITANVLLAAGASPAMIHAVEEVGDFTPIAGALSVNIGTISEPWHKAMLLAAEAANASGKPWVLDPVAHFATPYRSKATQALVALNPTIIRGNASEILALAGEAGAGKGVDSGDSVDTAMEAARHLAKAQGCVVAVTGETDFATNGTRAFSISGGSALMPQVTALGCSLSALVAAYAAFDEPLEATVAALLHYAEAGAQAAKTASGPGSFALNFLDQLAAVEPGTLDEGRLQWH